MIKNEAYGTVDIFQGKTIFSYWNPKLIKGSRMKVSNLIRGVIEHTILEITKATNNTGTNHKANSPQPLLQDKLDKLSDVTIKRHTAE